MRKAELEEVLRRQSDDVRVLGEEVWSAHCHGVRMHVFVNEAKDRMRIIASVTSALELTPQQLRSALESTFHGDARYGLYEEQLYAVFLHRLSSLTRTDLREAIEQVASLFESFDADDLATPMRFDWPRPADHDRVEGGARRVTEEAVAEAVARQKAQSERDSDDEPWGHSP